MFGQIFETRDLLTVGFLVVLESVLSIDNALVLGLLAKRLPKWLQRKALTYGLVGALVFRLLAICMASLLLKWHFIKLLGGAYLLYIAVRHLVFAPKGEAQEEKAALGEPEPQAAGGLPDDAICAPPPADHHLLHAARRLRRHFWQTVLVIELTDIAFAIDSIVAAIAMVGTTHIPPGQTLHPKLWVVLTGGMIGVLIIRFAATMFIKLLDRFPRFETAAYLLVLLIGSKLLLDWGFNPPGNPQGQSEHVGLDFHTPAHWPFWVFWGAMTLAFCVGFLPHRKKAGEAAGQRRQDALAGGDLCDPAPPPKGG